MRQTANYGLNQWEENDRILREDFNGDNSKIDEILANELSRLEEMVAGRMEFVVLQNQVVDGTKVSQIDVDLRNLNMAEWSFLFLEFSCSMPGQLWCNNSPNSAYYTCTGSSTQNGLADLQGSSLCIFPVLRMPERRVLPLIVDKGVRSADGYCSYADLKSFNLVGHNGGTLSYNMPIRLWGVR